MLKIPLLNEYDCAYTSIFHLCIPFSNFPEYKFQLLNEESHVENNIIACDIQMRRMCEVRIENLYRCFHTEKILCLHEAER